MSTRCKIVDCVLPHPTNDWQLLRQVCVRLSPREQTNTSLNDMLSAQQPQVPQHIGAMLCAQQPQMLPTHLLQLVAGACCRRFVCSCCLRSSALTSMPCYAPSNPKCCQPISLTCCWCLLLQVRVQLLPEKQHPDFSAMLRA
jgi:hypothetical protein